MPRVYVTQENPALNYLPAEKFGDLEFMTRYDYSSVKNSLQNEALVQELASKISRFNPAEDYVVVSGSPVVAAVVFMLLRERTPTVHMLRWSNRDRVYQPVTIRVGQR